MSIISFQEFQRLDMRVGLVINASRVEGTENLIKMDVDLGGERRQAVAGLAKWYRPEQLIGKKYIFVANLKPAKLRGVESNCMILAADDAKGKVVLLTPEADIDIGSKVR
ncbi:MAG: methionine--tRNA ligase subunit beta [Thermoproteota archaeon]